MIVYKITNKVNNKIYIGQTRNSLKSRWKSHRNAKYKSLLKLAINKYGKDNFTIELLDTANSLEELDNKEIYWINKLNSITPNGYNLTFGGNSRKKLSKKSLIKISKAQKLRFKKYEHPMKGKIGKLNHKSKRVICINTGDIFESCRQASIILGLNRSHVNAVARGERKHTEGYLFKYINPNN